MVDVQIASRGIRDQRVLAAFREIPRHLFVPDSFRVEAYADHPVSIGEGQTISQPFMVAAMVEALNLTGTERVLEIGTGSGYEAAILALLAREVYTVERIPNLLQCAGLRLAQLGYSNVYLRLGDGTTGWRDHAPYQAIIVSAGAPDVPAPLFEQLDEGGILVLPEGGPFSQTLRRIRKKKGQMSGEALMECMFVPLIGEYGWKEK